MVPHLIGRYEIVDELGRGGMATVYRAFDPQFGREVAIKVLPREFLHDPAFRARFEREARTIAALEHVAIVPVYDFGEHDGQPYLVMRYMPGGSLTERIEGGWPVALEEAAAIVGRIGAALDAAHRRGVIHRDVKPGNVLFDADGFPYLTDFGIVKLTEATAQLTGSGLVGTPAYMAPEMAQPGGLTPLIDIYALGVLLYQMLSGELPYDADTPMGLLMAHVTAPIPDIRECCPHLPPVVQTVVERALAKNPADRYQRAGEMADALRAVTVGGLPADAAAEKPPEPEPTVREAPLRELPTVEDTPPGLPTMEDAPRRPAEPPPVETVPLEEASPARPAPAPQPAPRKRRGVPAWVWVGGIVVCIALLVGGLALAGVLGGGAAAPPAPEPTEEEMTEEPAEEEPATEEPAEEAMTEEPATEEPATEAPAQEPTARPAPTERPTEPPTQEPTLTQNERLSQLAGAGVSRNADWTPHVESQSGVDMALVPAGCFPMGSTGGDSDEAPVHRVCFDEPFWIDVYEVTNQQYGSTGCWSSGSGFPRDCVNWADAQAHCQARGAHLPTEAEWEYAARGPDGLVYPWGNEFVAGNVVYRENSDGHAAAVGSRPGGASWVGAYDLSGNMWEWVGDWYDSSYYSTLPDGAVNPQGPGSGPARLLRGGGWDNNSSNARAANRVVQLAVNATDYAGFRCARSY